MKKISEGSIKREQDQQTKHKLPLEKKKYDEKATVGVRNRMAMNLTQKIISQTAVFSEDSSKSESEASESVVEVDELFIVGVVKNYGILDKETKKKYGITQIAYKFEVQQYFVIVVGRHGLQPKDGMPVGLYAPPAFKSAKDPITKMITVIIHRKIQDQCIDPLQYPYFTIDPDNCLYPTYICSWLQCKRRITIMHYIEYGQPANQSMIYGNAIHMYLEWLIKKQVEAVIPTENQIKKLYEYFLYDMYLIDTDFLIFADKCESSLINMVEWYVDHVIKGQRVVLNKFEGKYLKIERVIASEYVVKSKYFGIKGKVDGLFEGVYIDQKLNKQMRVSIPFQLKTGKNKYASHLKQTDLYVLLLRQQRNLPVVGILFYSQSKSFEYRMENPLSCFQFINVHRNKIIINLLNLFEMEDIIRMPKLPEMMDQCKFCNSAVQCGVLRKQIKDLEDFETEDANSKNTPESLHEDIRNKLNQITVIQYQYLQKWTKLIHMQEHFERKNMENSKNRKVFHSLTIELKQLEALYNYQGQQRIRLKIKKMIPNHELLEMIDNQIKIGEKMKIYIPLIKFMENCRIVGINKKSRNYIFEVEIRNKEVSFNRKKVGFLIEEEAYNEISAYFQKYENSFYNQMRGFVYKFVMKATPWLKSIILEENYLQQKTDFIVQKSKTEQYEGKIKGLNDDQRQAFRKAVSENRFTLVEGMPGTGKTQLILELIQYFYSEGKTVLVTSFTNQALSNILQRQIQKKGAIPPQAMIRDGSRFGVSEAEQKMTLWSQQFKTLQEYKDFFSQKKVWFVTISSLYLGHIPSKFDVVILDEASQCLQPICLEALLKGNKFILIGDERQLQPVVKAPSSKKQMSISLFERLCRLYPQQKTKLRKQYRMNKSIMSLSNKLVYNGELELAQKNQQDRILKIQQNWREKVPVCYQKIIDPQYPIRFINHDPAMNLISADNKSYFKVKKLLEIKLICELYKYYRQLGIQRHEILIISAYNILVSEIVKILKKEELIDNNNGDVLTIDRSQGTDKQIIIFLFQKGNKQLTQNPRRLNVALTRAKNKFIIIGSLKQLREIQTWTGELAKMLRNDEIETKSEIIENIFKD